MLMSRNPVQRGKLFKSGWSTEFTEGLYSGLRQVEIAKGLDLHGREASFPVFRHAIAPSGYMTTFANPGVSGSFIYTEIGEVIGRLDRSWERMNVAMFQHIFDAFEDIKRVTGVIGVRTK